MSPDIKLTIILTNYRFHSIALAVANMRSVNERQLLVFHSFGTEMVGAKRSHVGAALRVECSFVAIE